MLNERASAHRLSRSLDSFRCISSSIEEATTEGASSDLTPARPTGSACSVGDLMWHVLWRFDGV